MDIYKHICAWCQTEYVTGNASLPPPNWHWIGSTLICGDCDTATSFSEHSSASLSDYASGKIEAPAPGTAPKVKEPFTPRPKPMVDASGKSILTGNLWQIHCEFNNSHRLARSRTLTVAAKNPVEAFNQVETAINRHAASIASIEITPAPIDARQSAANERKAS